MAIQNLSRSEFEKILQEHVRPSSPIESFEHLYDRSDQLNRIEEALSSPGRHIFIYGDRGSGKTSLAKSAAYKHHPSESDPIFTSCGQKTSFADIVRDITFQFDKRSAYRSIDRTYDGGMKASVGGLEVDGRVSQVERQSELTGLDLNSATAAIKEAIERQPSKDRKVIVIDEFENLPSVEDRKLFAELIKQLSDRSVHVSLIFCGIGKSLNDLLNGHGSAQRYLEEVKLPSPPLSITGRWEIIDRACKALGLTIDDDSKLRIAQVSDGFPHYVHLIGQKLFWIAFRSQSVISELTPDEYIVSVREALGSVESRLRDAYDLATKKDQDNFEEILWSVADHYELERNNQRIYDDSYLRVMKSTGREPLTFKEFQSRLANLRSDRHGAILSFSRRGWVHFTENLIRGYVRLVAESKGVRLAFEHEPSLEPKKLTASSSTRGIDPTYQRPIYRRGL